MAWWRDVVTPSARSLRRARAAAAVVVAAAALGSFTRAAYPEPDAERRALPAPALGGGPSLSTVLATRRSQRTFAARALSAEELGLLLWAAQGVVDGHRTAPSAGALYPLTVHVVDASGTWRYLPDGHALVREARGDRRADVAAASFGQAAVRTAPVVLVITAALAITARKYGTRAERFATLEAGHVAQNLLLQATALGLAAVPVGAFDDEQLRHALDLGHGVTPLYVIPIGAP